MPVRKVSNRGGNIIGRFPSLKMGRMIAFESLLERDFIYLLDYVTAVTWFEEQPLVIAYQHEGRSRHYTPDFLLLENGRHVLVECKPECFMGTEQNQRQFAAAREWCRAQPWEFRLVTECTLRAGFLLENVKRLTRYARQTVAPGLRSRIQAVLHAHPDPLALDELVSVLALDDRTLAVASILSLAFHHEVCAALTAAPLSGATRISLSQPGQPEVAG